MSRRYPLRRMKPWSAAWRTERISSVMSWRSGMFIEIPMPYSYFWRSLYYQFRNRASYLCIEIETSYLNLLHPAFNHPVVMIHDFIYQQVTQARLPGQPIVPFPTNVPSTSYVHKWSLVTERQTFPKADELIVR